MFSPQSFVISGAVRKRSRPNSSRKRRFSPAALQRMKGLPLILLVMGLGAFSPAFSDDPGYNPDPGASLKPIQPPFYQTPPGTPPDYGLERDPLLDLPHAPLIDIHYDNEPWHNRDYPKVALPAYTVGVPDRWYMQIPELDIQHIPVWMRYNSPDRETPYMYNTPR